MGVSNKKGTPIKCFSRLSGSLVLLVYGGSVDKRQLFGEGVVFLISYTIKDTEGRKVVPTSTPILCKDIRLAVQGTASSRPCSEHNRFG